jgi:hypothetical protein
VTWTDNLLALAERCEVASGPDRELDGRIWLATDPEAWAKECSFIGNAYAGHVHTKVEKHEHEVRMGARLAPPFTSSFPSALSLVPEWCAWHLRALNVEGEREYSARIDYAQWQVAATPELAICSVALRARASQAPTPDVKPSPREGG